MSARWLAVATAFATAACEPLPPPITVINYPPRAPAVQWTEQSVSVPAPPVAAPAEAEPDRVVVTTSDFEFVGGRLDFEVHQSGTRVRQIVRNRYMIPVVIAWEVSGLANLEPTGPLHGVVVVPPGSAPDTDGPEVELATFSVADPRQSWNRHFAFHARFGDPNVRPQPYAYALPYAGTFSVLQGFHGAFSHRGSNEYAVDFDCPVATTVRAARPGVVVVTYDAVQGSGTTPDFLDYSHVNFVLVLHDDGTLGEYMHLSPSGVEVQPGQRVERGQALALSGNTGYSTTPHLHFQVMTAANDGIAAQSFPFEIAVGKDHSEAPAQGRSYTSWE